MGAGETRVVSTPTVAVVIPTWNGRDLLRECLDALAGQTLAADSTVVVDNGSNDGTCEMLATEYPGVRLVAFDHNTGFARAVNAGILATETEWVALLNNDAVPEATWLAELTAAATFADASVGLLASKIVSLDGTLIDSAGDYFDTTLTAGQRGHGERDDGRYDNPAPVFSACAGATLYRRATFDELKGFDEHFFAYYEDVDLSFRARLAGWSACYVPGARVRHHVSATTNRQPGMKRYLSTRNSWYLVVRNVPAPMLRAHLLRFLVRQAFGLVSAVAVGEVGASLRGHAAAVWAMPRLFAQRRVIQRSAVIGPDEIAKWLEPAQIRQRLEEAVIRHAGWSDEIDENGAPFNPDATLRYDAPVASLKCVHPALVLEVGSGSGGLAEYAQPPLLVGVDFDFAATSDRDGTALIRVQASATALPFADGTFDAVVSMDMLEHINPSGRAAAISELLRVAGSDGLVVCGVPAGWAAERADRWLDGMHRRRHGSAHPWISEHIEYGLPRRTVLVGLFRQAGAGHIIVRGNANLAAWMIMQRALSSRHENLLFRRASLALGRALRVGPYYRTVLEARR